MTGARADVDQKIQGQSEDKESVGKRPYLCGNTGDVIWLDRVPKSPDEYLQLAKQLNASEWGDNHLFYGEKLAQVISDLIEVAHGRYKGEHLFKAVALGAENGSVNPESSSSEVQAAPVSQQLSPPSVLPARSDEKQQPIKLSLSRSTSMLFQQPPPLSQQSPQLVQNTDSTLPEEDIVDFSQFDDDGRPAGFESVDNDSNDYLNGFRRR